MSEIKAVNKCPLGYKILALSEALIGIGMGLYMGYRDLDLQIICTIVGVGCCWLTIQIGSGKL